MFKDCVIQKKGFNTFTEAGECSPHLMRTAEVQYHLILAIFYKEWTIFCLNKELGKTEDGAEVMLSLFLPRHEHMKCSQNPS